MTFLDVLNFWSSGDVVPPNTYIYSIKAVWWLRAAKIIQFIAAMIVVIDIVGIIKLRKYGESLKAIYSISKLKKKPTILRKKRIIEQLERRIKDEVKEDEFIYDSISDGKPIVGFKNGTDYTYQPMRHVARLNPKYNKRKVEEIELYNKNVRQKIERYRRSSSLLYEPSNITYLAFLLYVTIWLNLDSYIDSLALIIIAKFMIVIVVGSIVYYVMNRLVEILVLSIIKSVVFTFEFLLLEPVGWLLSHGKLKKIALVFSFFLIVIGTGIDLLLS